MRRARDAGLESGRTGLGLYLVNRLVTKYGGTVWIEDNNPVGAIFITERLMSEYTGVLTG
jgi:signal transduction histidine kinase